MKVNVVIDMDPMKHVCNSMGVGGKSKIQKHWNMEEWNSMQ